MTTYKVADGHDVALLDLDDISPQCRSRGIQSTRRTYSAGTSIKDQGLYVELLFSAMENATVYNAMLAQFGLDNADTAAVTVYVRDRRWLWSRWNGTAVLPRLGEDADWDIFPKDIVLLIKNLTEAA